MNRFAHALLIATTLALPLAACESINNFDPTDIIPDDPFGNKKKLTGERKPVFPEGVPGLARGVPPELMRDQQPGSDIAQDQQTPPRRAAVEEQSKSKARPKAKAAPKSEQKPEIAASPSTPTPVTVRRSDSPSPFPDPPPTGQQQPPPAGAPWPGEARGQGGGVQWPDPPPPSR
jgi:hypothetical protein